MTTPRRGRPGYDREQLLLVAAEVFTRHGYDRTTIDQLAAALGLSKSSIYHHVSGKEELLADALERALGSLEQALDEVSADSPLGALERAVRASVRVLADELPFVTLLLRVHGNTNTERAALRRRRAIDQRFADMVTQAQHSGELRADFEPHLVARLVFGTVNSLVEWYRPSRGAHAGEIADILCAMVFDGLSSR